MKRITPLFFVLAAVALFAGKQEDEKATLYPPGVPYVVPEELRRAGETAANQRALRREPRRPHNYGMHAEPRHWLHGFGPWFSRPAERVGKT